MEIKKKIKEENFILFCKEKNYSMEVLVSNNSMMKLAELSYIMMKTAKEFEQIMKEVK